MRIQIHIVLRINDQLDHWCRWKYAVSRTIRQSNMEEVDVGRLAAGVYYLRFGNNVKPFIKL